MQCIHARAWVFASVVLVFGLLGCASSSSSTRALATVIRGQPSAVSQAITQGKLNPNLSYLHVTVNGRPPVLMVLGYVDQVAAGTLMSWYSADGELLQTIDGHIIGLHGVPEGVSGVTLAPRPVLTWPASGQPVVFERSWDMPAQYRFGLRERVRANAVLADELPPQVSSHFKQHLGTMPAGDWNWFAYVGEEGRAAWYARASVRGLQQTVYSYQCLSRAFCLHLAPWPLPGGMHQ